MALDRVVSAVPISLPLSNPFASGSMIVFDDGTGELTREVSQYIPSQPDRFYTVKYDDTITQIAYQHYKDEVQLPSRYWWVIADANLIDNPLDISEYIGKEIVIPNIRNFKLTS